MTAETLSEFEPDAVLLGSVDFARSALDQITPAETVGDYVGHTVHDEHVLSLKFESLMPGYPDWNWTVTLSRTDADAQPNVLETELMPGEGSVLSPAWVPWSLRLEEYEAEHDELAAADDQDEDDDDDGLDDEDLDDEDLDDEDLDDEDLDDEGLDLDGHIVDDDALADQDQDEDEDEDDGYFVGSSNDAESPVDASVLISAANATPPTGRGRGARRRSEVDVKADGLRIVTPDDRASSSVYFDEEVGDLGDDR